MATRLVSIITLALFACAPLHAGDLFTKHKRETPRLEPTDSMATVYVFRPGMMGAAVKTWAFWDETLIGVSKARGYSSAHVPPGSHTFWSKAENVSELELDVKPGETYYFKQSIKVGMAKARVKMVRIDAAEAEKLFKKCGYVEPTSAGRARAAEIVAARFARAAASSR